jgi:hypothetical protein
MKILLLFVCALSATYGMSQTTLFQDDFETGSSQWTLNTGSGANTWVVNNVYLGFAGLIPDTPSQPIVITNSPQSTYMHITNQSVCGGLSVCNANFDTGSATDQNTEISTSIDATGYTNVTVSFWYLCAGQTNVSYGTMEYSIDGGLTWVGTGTSYVNTSSWTLESVSLPAWDNVSAFKVRFKWQNGGGGLDPAFSIDQMTIIGTPGITNSLTVVDLQPTTAWCFGAITTLQTTFDAVGTYNAGNVFTAELSDASGSFATPTAVGTLASSTTGTQLMTVIVPGTVPVGSGYRVRVVASDPITVGSDNGFDLAVYPLPAVSSATYGDVCVNGIPFPLTGGIPSGGTYSGSGVSGSNFSPNNAGVGITDITYVVVDINGCSNTVLETITVLNAPAVQFDLAFTSLCINYAPYTLTGGTPAGGVYSGPGVSGGVFDPSVAGIGSWTLTYDVTDPNGCTGQSSTILQVTPCVDLPEKATIDYSIYPNPTEGSFTIITDVDFDTIELRDLNGRLIQRIAANELIDVSGLSAGVYIIELNDSGQHYTERIIIK